MSKRFPGHPRIAAVLILVAAALVLLRPLCESWQGAPGLSAVGFAQDSTSTHPAAAHNGDSSDVACCASGDIGVVATVRDMDVGKSAASAPLAPSLLPVAVVVLPGFAPAAFPRRPRSRAPASYHRRSARILR